jgi:hypothetical protein
VDYVESNYSKLPLLGRLLNAGTGSVKDSANQAGSEAPKAAETMLVAGRGSVVTEELPDSQ